MPAMRGSPTTQESYPKFHSACLYMRDAATWCMSFTLGTFTALEIFFISGFDQKKLLNAH